MRWRPPTTCGASPRRTRGSARSSEPPTGASSTVPRGEPGRAHAEVAALDAAGDAAAGRHALRDARAVLPPRDAPPPCVDAILAVRRRSCRGGHRGSRSGGVGLGHRARSVTPASTVDVGIQGDKVTRQLAPYLKHRRTGRPWVVLKLAATLDGGTAAPNGIEPVDHLPAGPRRRPPSPGRVRRHPRRGGDGSPRRPLVDRPRLPATRRSAVGQGRSRPRRARRSARQMPRCSRAWSGRVRSGRCSTSSGATGSSSCWSRAEPTSRATSTDRASSTATSSTWHRRCSAATTPTACSATPGPSTSPTSGEGGSPRSSGSATTSASSSLPMSDDESPARDGG